MPISIHTSAASVERNTRRWRSGPAGKRFERTRATWMIVIAINIENTCSMPKKRSVASFIAAPGLA